MVEKATAEEPKFSSIVTRQAQSLIDEHGTEVENATTEMLIEVLDRGEINEILQALRVRQCIRLQTNRERYTRRLPDKIVWAVEQAIDQGRVSIARLLGRAYRDAKVANTDVPESRRQEDQA